jgi:hypothetical protein
MRGAERVGKCEEGGGTAPGVVTGGARGPPPAMLMSMASPIASVTVATHAGHSGGPAKACSWWTLDHRCSVEPLPFPADPAAGAVFCNGRSPVVSMRPSPMMRSGIGITARRRDHVPS